MTRGCHAGRFEDRGVEQMQDMSVTDWQSRMAALGEEFGHYEELGRAHAALFSQDAPVLLVTFELRNPLIDSDEEGLPLGYRIAQEGGWSSLTLIAEDATWFRSPEVYAYFDRLVDDGFFEDFDRVVFYGAGSCGYAACAFSVAAPGATVLAIQPQATLEPLLAGWDDRFPEMRQVSFDDRYGFAPDMMEGAEQGYIIYDPLERLDAMHAALFYRPNIKLMPCILAGGRIASLIARCGQLELMIARACEGKLTPRVLRHIYRDCRKNISYTRNLLRAVDAMDRPYMEALVCHHAAVRLKAPRLRKRYNKLVGELAKKGIILEQA
ncbi:phosphoadenosine phosphosulfate reductase [Thioclava sp. GXIMD2076]|uniref:Phosphoadenosine phosphosulfate reductase n=1 Tax=Thioclava kandeliae TaxID=3070818 RepID=A0ABV1SBQ8_9RHOB